MSDPACVQRELAHVIHVQDGTWLYCLRCGLVWVPEGTDHCAEMAALTRTAEEGTDG